MLWIRFDGKENDVGEMEALIQEAQCKINVSSDLDRDAETTKTQCQPLGVVRVFVDE